MCICLQVERFVPTKVIRVHNIDKPWFYDDCRRAFHFKQDVDWSGLLVSLEGKTAVSPFWWQVVLRSICHPLAIRLPVSLVTTFPCSLQVMGGLTAHFVSGFLLWNWLIRYGSSFFEVGSWCYGPLNYSDISASSSLGQFSCLLESS